MTKRSCHHTTMGNLKVRKLFHYAYPFKLIDLIYLCAFGTCARFDRHPCRSARVGSKGRRRPSGCARGPSRSSNWPLLIDQKPHDDQQHEYPRQQKQKTQNAAHGTTAPGCRGNARRHPQQPYSTSQRPAQARSAPDIQARLNGAQRRSAQALQRPAATSVTGFTRSTAAGAVRTRL